MINRFIYEVENVRRANRFDIVGELKLPRLAKNVDWLLE